MNFYLDKLIYVGKEINTKFAHEHPTAYANIRQCLNYNGSGSNAFGGHKKWPCIDIHIALPVNISNQEGKKLTIKLAKFIEEQGYTMEKNNE